MASRIAFVVMIVILLLSAGYTWLQISNMKATANQVTTSYGTRMAESYTRQLDTKRLEQFMANPQEDELYWSIRQDLDQFRRQIGALYVYFVRIDESRRPLIMIDGQPKDSDSASPINEVTDIPPAAIQDLLKGTTAHSALIDNPQYGKYISSYAPVKLPDGTLLGVIGIDTEAAVTDSIASSVIRESIPFYILMVSLALLGIGLIVWLLIRAIHPLKRIVSSAENVAAGNFMEANRQLLEYPVRSQDEVGALYQAIVTMSGSLNTIVGGIVSSVARMSDQLVTASDRFSAEARDLLEMNTRVNEASKQVAGGSQTQRTNSEEGARAMEEIASTLQRISEASLTVSDASVNALHSAQSGRNTISRMNHQIRTISSATEETVQRVTSLHGYSQEIAGALAAISEIANQTKLLALNASIEAARAGEHGAGFAVVASEVRELAEDSFHSTSQIASLLHNIQNESLRISEAMKSGSEEVRAGSELSEEAETSFANVVELFRLVSEQIREISASTEQMTASSEEVSATVIEIADIAKATSDQTLQIGELTDQQLHIAQYFADSAKELNEMTHRLRESVKQIRV
ncbi:methyl-accepting chemotaxis protein [Paenibacillus sp. FJAT-26967]|uniref:methyl-accepting chemotaxis protein n=1 Tax=Paenibacillus sp. FJAT-26967 TaxID=1729690 RepID=UPI001560F0FB|nr:HAMP domain-containing methyl-accepting chemotaxis protein [Paenibacillus sp. FJAT-26967]